MSEIGTRIKVYLTSGKVDQFTLTDATQPGILAELLSPHKVFAGPPLTVSDEQGITAIRTASIYRIDLTGPAIPSWPYIGNAVRVTEATQEEFDGACESPDVVRQRREAWEKPGAAPEGFMVLDMVNGEKVIWRIKMKSAQMIALDVATVSRQFINAGALHGERINGGLMIINTVHAERMSFHPCPPQRAGRLLLVKRD